ncbi:hypothetical protein Trydic_g17751 [Trypoxylus dichotomus]
MTTNTILIRGKLLYEYTFDTKAAVATQKICTAFGDDAVSDGTIQKWFKTFSLGDLRLTDEAHSGRPKINEDLKQVVEENSSSTCLELAERLNVSDETIRLHLHQLGKTWKLSK